jgi:hypothetical protein
MLYVIHDMLSKVALNTNKTGQHVIYYTWHIIESGVKHKWNCSPCYTLYLTHCWKCRSTPIKLFTMLYLIPDTLLKVTFNTNKTGDYVICNTWHIIGGGVQHQLNWSPCYTLYLTHCWNWCSTPIQLVTMLYIIPNTLLKVAF